MKDRLPFVSSRHLSLFNKPYQRVGGTLLFSDISGFTPLSESLGKIGKLGTEELTEILNNYFSLLLHIVRKYEGDVLLFAGDAILAGFYGDSTHPRAESCANEMMKAMGQFSSIKTTAGVFSIGIKIVYVTGEWNEMLLGNDRDKLFFATGRVLETLTELEDSAKRGEIKDCVIKKTALKPPKFEPNSSSIEKLVPPQLIEFEKVTRGEHRPVVTLFFNFTGFNPENPDFKILNHLFSTAIKIVRERGGYPSKAMVHTSGGIIMCLFGAPEGIENTLERAVEAGLSLTKINIPGMKFRVGINSGYVYSGIIGDYWRKEFTVLGDSVNLSERLMEISGWGEVRLPRNILRLGKNILPTNPKNVRVKGKKKKIVVVIPQKISFEERETLFVGRKREKKLLYEMINKGGIIVISGPGGIGKSSLVKQVRLENEKTIGAIWGYAETTGKPYSVFTTMIEGKAGKTPDDVKKYIQKIKKMNPQIGMELERGKPFLLNILFPESFPPPELPPEARFIGLCNAIKNFIVLSLEGKRKKVVIIDDAHKLLEDDWKVIDFLKRSILKEKDFSMILLTRDPKKIPLERFSHIRLQPMGIKDSSEILKNLLEGKEIDRNIFAVLYERSRGNPFYLEQMILDMKERGIIEKRDNKWRLAKGKELNEIPLNIFSAIISRIDRLRGISKKALRVGSVIGMEFPAAIVGRAIKIDNIEEVLDHPVKENILFKKVYQEIEYIFRHTIIRDVIYQSILIQERKGYHWEIAEILEEIYGVNPSIVSYSIAIHYREAGASNRAFLHFICAGEWAYENYLTSQALKSFKEAINIYERGEAQPDQNALFRAYKGIADILESLGMYSETKNVITEMLELFPEKEKLAETLNINALLCIHTGRTKEAEEILIKSLKLVEENRSEPYGEALVRMGLLLRIQGRYRKAINYLNKAIDFYKEKNDMKKMATAFNTLGSIYYVKGEYNNALEYYKRGLTIVENLKYKYGMCATYLNIGGMYFSMGDYKMAKNYFKEGLKISQEIGFRQKEALYLNNLGVLYKSKGNKEKAMEFLKRSLKIKKELDDKKGIYGSIVNIADILYDEGEFERAYQEFKYAYKLSKSIGHKSGEALTLVNMGNIELEKCNYIEALKLYKRAEKIYRKIENKGGIFLSNINKGIVGTQIGLIKMAITSYKSCYNTIKNTGNKVNEALIFRDLGYAYFLKGDYSKAIDLISNAKKIYQSIENKEEELLTRVKLNEIFAHFGIKSALYDVTVIMDKLKDHHEYFSILQSSIEISIKLEEYGYAQSLMELFDNNIEKECELIGWIKLLKGIIMKQRGKQSKKLFEDALYISKEQWDRILNILSLVHLNKKNHEIIELAKETGSDYYLYLAKKFYGEEDKRLLKKLIKNTPEEFRESFKKRLTGIKIFL